MIASSKSSGLIIAVLLALSGCAVQSERPVQPAGGSNMQSGLQKGDDAVPWNPVHVAGPNRGTNACPLCTYEARPAVIIFTKDNPEVPALAQRLEKLVIRNQARQLKGFVVVLDSSPERLKQMAADLNISQIGVCCPNPTTRSKDLSDYKINPAATNTIMIYKDYKISANFVDVSVGNFDRIESAVANLP